VLLLETRPAQPNYFEEDATFLSTYFTDLLAPTTVFSSMAGLDLSSWKTCRGGSSVGIYDRKSAMLSRYLPTPTVLHIYLPPFAFWGAYY
jgi:hypothetical protein